MSSSPPSFRDPHSGPAKGAPPVVLYAGSGTPRALPRVALRAPGHDESSETRLKIPLHRHLFVICFLFFSVALTYGNSFQSGWVLDNKYIIQLDPRNKQPTWEN